VFRVMVGVSVRAGSTVIFTPKTVMQTQTIDKRVIN